MFGIAVFPGQGSQRKGMGLDFALENPKSKDIFKRASGVLGIDMEALMDDEDRLGLTEFAQPAILTAEMAMFEALKDQYGLAPQVFGGHSLGEYSALVAAGVLSLEDGLKIVRLRGQLMQNEAPVGMGAMAAVIADGLPLDQVEQLSLSQEVDIANDNSSTQVVLSGEKNRLAAVLESLRTLFQGKEFRLVPLEVSAPFHSRYMAPMEQKFKDLLLSMKERFDITKLSSVTSNVTGTFHKPDVMALVDSLTRQISGRVRWRDNMKALLDRAAGVIEIGPGRPLGGFFKSIMVSAASIVDIRTAQRAFTPRA